MYRQRLRTIDLSTICAKFKKKVVDVILFNFVFKFLFKMFYSVLAAKDLSNLTSIDITKSAKKFSFKCLFKVQQISLQC